MNLFSSIVISLTSFITMATSTPHWTTTTFPTTTIYTSPHLTITTYHLPPHPVSYQNSTALTFSPTAFTLLTTPHSALLIDAPATTSQGTQILAWLHATLSPQQRFKGVMVTHGHGDHFFSAPQIVKEFPGASIFATRGVWEHMVQQYDADFYGAFWGSLFPGGQIDDDVELVSGEGRVTVLGEGEAANVLLEGGLEVRAVQVGQGDTHDSSVIWVPSVGLVVGGDVVYGSCHQLLVEDATPELRELWRKSLDEVKALEPKIVVPSHMLPDEGYGPEHVQETRRYIDVWEAERAKAGTWQELEAAMAAAFPKRGGTFILRWTSQAPYDAAF